MKATTALVGSLLLGGVSWVDCQSLKGTAEVLGAITEDREVARAGPDGGGEEEADTWADKSDSWRWNAEAGWRPVDRRRNRGSVADVRSGGAYLGGLPRWSDQSLGRYGDYDVVEQKEGTRMLEAEEQQQQPEIDWERVKGDRIYLNGLVEASVLKTREQECNVAFAKTHKTASTTMAMILVRYARRHHKKLASFTGHHVSEIPLWDAAQQTKDSGERVDVMHYHYTPAGEFGGRWEAAKKQYENIMREDERINYITVLRSPRAHLMSYYYYYIQPDTQLSLQHFFSSKRNDDRFKGYKQRLYNPMCHEFGIRSEEQLTDFIDNQLPDLRLTMLTEKFDEGLMVMRRLLGWDMIDMTYARMMQTKKGSRRWDGKQLKDVPDFYSLPKWLQDRVDQRTRMDKRLYEAAEVQYAKQRAVVAKELDQDLEEFERLQHIMAKYLEFNTSSDARKWYAGNTQPYLGGPPFYAF